MKLERQYTRELKKVLAVDLENAVILKHADQVTSGIPDLSVTWNKLPTFWIEVKRGLTIKARGIQVFTAIRLAKQGHCFFVLYGEDSTSIFTPEQVKAKLPAVAIYPGTDHHAIAAYVRSLS